MKRTLSLILAFVMLLGMFPMSVFADEADTTFAIYLETDVAEPSALKINDTITVTAKIRNNPGFAGMKTKLTWDNSVVRFVGFETETYKGKQVLKSDLIDGEYNQTVGTVVVGESTNITRDGMLWTAKFTVLKDGDAGIALSTDSDDFQMVNADKESLVDSITIDQTALEGLTITHECDYKETVVDPTCTQGGYTEYKCACGDSYTTNNTPALGHNYADGVCTRCGAAGTTIPEDAKFTDMITDEGKTVNIIKKEDHYLVEVPYGTTSLLVTYPEDLPGDDGQGYVTTKVTGFKEVSDSGYGKTTKDGKVIVGLVLEKAADNGGASVIRLINLEYETNPKTISILMKDGTRETFALTYMLGNGEHFAILPYDEETVGYTVTGSPIASDGYTFNVALEDGYMAGENFAVKVNGEVIATEPGEISVTSVVKDIKVTVEGVQKILADTDISVTFDFSEYTGAFDGVLQYKDNNSQTHNETVQTGKANTLNVVAADCMNLTAQVYKVSPYVVGWEVNGEEYPIPSSLTSHTLDNGVVIQLNSDGYLSTIITNQTPCTIVIKPILTKYSSVGAAPPFNEECIAVNDITVVGADVESYAWDGDTLNVILAEDTAQDASIKTVWNVSVNNTTAGATNAMFLFNGVAQSASAVSTIDAVIGAALEDGVGTMTAAFAEYTAIPLPSFKISFTSKTFTVNFYVSGKEPAPTYTVNIDENITGGTVTATPNPAEANATVTLTQVPHAGYEFMEFSVTDAEGNAVTVNETMVGEDITYTFTMPAGNVTVSAEYLELPNTITEYDVSHPLMEEKQNVTIGEDTFETINVLSLFQGYAEKLIEVIETLVEDKISAQHLKFTSSNEDVAKIEDGKVIPVGPGIALITVEPADNEAAAATFALLRDNNAQQFAVEVIEVPAGYTVVMPADTDPNLGDVISVEVTVGSDTANAPVNAYDMTFTYDPAKLELVSQNTDSTNTETYLEGLHVGGEIPAGTIHMERYGQNQTAGDVAFTLKFKVLEAGNAAIQVTSAKVGTSQEALESDASVATLADPVTQIISSYGIKLPAGFDGASSVAPNKNYTFTAQDVHYDYTFKVTVGGTVVENAVVDNEDGTFTIAKDKINGNVQIELVGDPEGKFYDVDLTGAEDLSGAETAQYMAADGYTATLTPAEGYHYNNLTVTIGGAAYSGYETVKNENGTTSYKIPGKDITGDIVFTHDKSQLAANEVPVSFTGNGAADRAAGTAEKATKGEAYSFTLDKKAGFNYTVTYKMGDAEDFTDMMQNDNVYSIGKVTGAITINIEKVNDLEVQITNYIDLDGKTMFLVTATQTLEEGKALAYDNTPMFQKTYTYVTETPEGTTTEEKTEWVYLVMVDKAAEGAEPVVFDAAAAKAKITDITATTTVLGKTFNVNESGIGDGDSVGTVDINDAQLVYDMYMKLYDTLDATMMRKFLKADVNGDKTVGVNDAAAIVNHIIAAKNA